MRIFRSECEGCHRTQMCWAVPECLPEHEIFNLYCRECHEAGRACYKVPRSLADVVLEVMALVWTCIALAALGFGLGWLVKILFF